MSSTATITPQVRAPRTFVETMGYVPDMAVRRIAEKKAAGEILFKAMNEYRCKRCECYNTGCLPGQIILCTKRFLDDVEKGMEEADDKDKGNV